MPLPAALIFEHHFHFMTKGGKIGLVILGALVFIQIFRPERNVQAGVAANDITRVTEVPADVQGILKKACYDCHSNNTVYPWYMNVQPVAWWLARHVDEGKRELNFSAFGEYSAKKQLHKLQEIHKEVEEGDMPLSSYTLMHSGARLSKAEQQRLIAWSDSLAAGYGN